MLDPKLVKGDFTPEEDQILLEAVEKYGTGRWKDIQKLLPNRTDNKVKTLAVVWDEGVEVHVCTTDQQIAKRWKFLAKQKGQEMPQRKAWGYLPSSQRKDNILTAEEIHDVLVRFLDM